MQCAEHREDGTSRLVYVRMMPTDLVTRVVAIAGYEGRVRALERVVPLLASPPGVPAAKLVWVASGATDGQTRLEVRLTGRTGMFSRVLRNRLRRLLGCPVSPVEIGVTTVPGALPTLTEERGA